MIGYLEPHDRPETAALAEGLEVVPRLPRRARRRSSSRRWTSTPSIRRAPELALVDELAHTNAPGSRNAKRYQDIDEILDAGIDVISTVNIQHLESLNDAVFELTGVRVRETFPDRMLDEADEVVLVDLSPEALQDRLRAGKVYPGGQAERALLNFFRQDNLSRAPRARAARGRGGRRGAPRHRPCSIRSASRPSASASSRSSSRSRGRSACSAARGGRPSASAARSTRSGCGSPGRSSPRRRRRSSPRSGASPSILGVALPRGGGRRSRRRRCGASPTSAARRTSSSARPTSGAGWRSCAARSSRAMVRELPGIDIRVVAHRALGTSCDT